MNKEITSVAYKVVMVDRASGLRSSWSNSYRTGGYDQFHHSPISRIFYDEDKYSYAYPPMVELGLGLCVFGCLDDAKQFIRENGRSTNSEIWLVEISEHTWEPKVPLHFRPDTLEQAKDIVARQDFDEKWPTGTLMTEYARLIEKVYSNF